MVAKSLELVLHDGELDAFAWPGGYPIVYQDAEESILCPACATKSLDDSIPQFRPVDWFVHYEGSPFTCDQCGVEIASAYGANDGSEA